MFQVRWWWYDLDEDRPPPSPFLLLIKMYTFHTEHVDTLVVAILVVYRIYCVFIQHDNEDGKPGSLPVWTRDVFSHSLLNPWRTVLYDLFFTLKLEFNILRSSSSLSFIWNPTSSTRWLFEEGLGLLVGPLVTGEWFYFTLCTKGSSFLPGPHPVSSWPWFPMVVTNRTTIRACWIIINAHISSIIFGGGGTAAADASLLHNTLVKWNTLGSGVNAQWSAAHMGLQF